MSKSEFIRRAPLYYALAIAVAVRTGDGQTRETVRRYYAPNGDELIFYLDRDVLLDEAIVIAHRLGLIEVTQPDFGSPIINRSASYWEAWRNAKTPGSPFEYFDKAGDGGHSWLREAIDSISTRFGELIITKNDFKTEDQDWEPIPLDRRSDDKLKEALRTVDATIEEVRADNGYAATAPEERNYVLDKLRSANKRLSEDAQITWMYLKNFVLEPLGILISRFGKASVGVAAGAAKKAVIDWLKSKGINILDDLFK